MPGVVVFTGALISSASLVVLAACRDDNEVHADRGEGGGHEGGHTHKSAAVKHTVAKFIISQASLHRFCTPCLLSSFPYAQGLTTEESKRKPFRTQYLGHLRVPV